MSTRARVGAALACLVLGGGMLGLLETPATTAAGVLLLVGWVAFGVAAIVSPSRLSGEDEGDGGR